MLILLCIHDTGIICMTWVNVLSICVILMDISDSHYDVRSYAYINKARPRCWSSSWAKYRCPTCNYSSVIHNGLTLGAHSKELSLTLLTVRLQNCLQILTIFKIHLPFNLDPVSNTHTQTRFGPVSACYGAFPLQRGLSAARFWLRFH